MNLLPRKRTPEAVTQPPASGVRALAARLRGFLVAHKVRAVLGRPGATASAAAAGVVVGVVLGAALVTLAIMLTQQEEQ